MSGLNLGLPRAWNLNRLALGAMADWDKFLSILEIQYTKRDPARVCTGGDHACSFFGGFALLT